MGIDDHGMWRKRELERFWMGMMSMAKRVSSREDAGSAGAHTRTPRIKQQQERQALRLHSTSPPVLVKPSF